MLKAGGAYVPIKLNYPIDRQEYVLKDATPKVVITYKLYMKMVNKILITLI
ncbi:hypothetical protein ACVXZY_15270 [Staphylococcus aureus]